ncbi:MAG: hypothetical protein R2780_08155 [Crocinitomicaceae bacterium]
MSKKKSKSRKNILEQYNEKQTKGNVENTLLKSAVDTVASSVIGTGIGAITGDKAAFAGIALILAGHYVGDESGLLRLTGASTMAYGIGKSSEYTTNHELNTVGKRISALKDDWLTAFHLKWQKETNQESTLAENKTTESQNPVNEESKSENTSIDVSGMDQFEQMNEDLAKQYHEDQSKQPEYPTDDIDDYPDNIDLTLI